MGLYNHGPECESWMNKNGTCRFCNQHVWVMGCNHGSCVFFEPNDENDEQLIRHDCGSYGFHIERPPELYCPYAQCNYPIMPGYLATHLEKWHTADVRTEKVELLYRPSTDDKHVICLSCAPKASPVSRKKFEKHLRKAHKEIRFITKADPVIYVLKCPLCPSETPALPLEEFERHVMKRHKKVSNNNV